jgi:heme o synthase
MKSSAAIVRPAGPAASLRDYLELSKARIVLMIVLTTAAGYAVGASGRVEILALLHVVIGTAFVAAGTNALNQYMERGYDRLMNRTRLRPLPDGRMVERTALIFSTGISIFGLLYLWAGVGWLPAVVALATLLIYLLLYTPLKRKSSWSLLVGAVPGALPPVIGWAAARGDLGMAAWVMFAIMFAWQIPHFLAIGWLYREDYGRAGFAMLSVSDRDGRSSARQALAWSFVLAALAVIPLLIGMAGMLFTAGALAAALMVIAFSFAFLRERSDRSARSLFLISNIYLPVVMILLVIDSRL